MSRPILIGPMVLAATPAAALAASAPNSFRIAGETFGLFESWLAAAGLLCPLFALAIAAGRAARRSGRALAPDAAPKVRVGLALWASLALPVTAALGAFLKANTHHRALGGATFAVLALAVHLGSALVAWRATALVLPRLGRGRGAFALASLAVAVALLVFTIGGAALAQDARTAAGPASSLPGLLIDAALALVVIVLASALDVRPDRVANARWVGGGSLVFVVAVGLALCATRPGLVRAFGTEAPLAGSVADVLGLTPDPR